MSQYLGCWIKAAIIRLFCEGGFCSQLLSDTLIVRLPAVLARFVEPSQSPFSHSSLTRCGQANNPLLASDDLLMFRNMSYKEDPGNGTSPPFGSLKCRVKRLSCRVEPQPHVTHFQQARHLKMPFLGILELNPCQSRHPPALMV